jgi:hypothetical protein
MSDTHSKEESFMVLEYNALRSEIDEDIKELRKLETFAITSTGVTWGWLLLENTQQAAAAKRYELAIWLPFVLTCILFCKRLIVAKGIRMKGDYLSELEEHFYKDEIIPTRRNKLGWESRLRGSWKNQWLLTAWSPVGLYWIILLGGTLIIPLVVRAIISK